MQFFSKAIAALLLFISSLIVTETRLVHPISNSSTNSAIVAENAQSGSVDEKNQILIATPTVLLHWINVSPSYGIPNGADRATYQIFATSSDAIGVSPTDDLYCFSRDRTNVYLSDGELVSTSSKSFIAFGAISPQSGDYCYGKDEAHAYAYAGGDGPQAGGGILKEADPITFMTDASIYPFAKDATHVFLADAVVDEADSNTFSVIPDSGLAKDATHVFVFGSYTPDWYTELIGADPATFNYNAETNIATDKSHVWAGGSLGSGIPFLKNVAI